MRIRPYTAADCPAVLALFYNTVHTVNRRDYTPAQLDAWAPAGPDAARWDASLKAHAALVAVDQAGGLLGFGDMDTAAGYLDRLYVAARCQRQGVGGALCGALEALLSPGTRVTVQASLTARPFFEARGYRVIRAQQVERRGVTLPNLLMEKRLPGPVPDASFGEAAQKPEGGACRNRKV